MTTPAKKPDAPEEVSVTVRLPKSLHKKPKSLHKKLTDIAASEGKSLTAKLAQAARERAATYERTSKTAAAYTRKKRGG